jgi:hypothetical protein
VLQGRDRALAWALPIVLILVALNQIHWAHTRDLTPWKGGGFGMFASVDLLTYRPIKAEFVTDAGTIPIEVHDFRDASDHASKLYTNARGLPDDRRLRQFAHLMFEAEWTVTDGVAEFASWLDDPDAGPVVHDTDGGGQLEVERMDMEIWRVTYERGDEFIIPELIRTFHIAADGEVIDP